VLKPLCFVGIQHTFILLIKNPLAPNRITIRLVQYRIVLIRYGDQGRRGLRGGLSMGAKVPPLHYITEVQDNARPINGERHLWVLPFLNL